MVAEPELQPPGRVLALLEVMKKGKDNGWEGAFGFICCLITLVWARAPTRQSSATSSLQNFGV